MSDDGFWGLSISYLIGETRKYGIGLRVGVKGWEGAIWTYGTVLLAAGGGCWCVLGCGAHGVW